MNIQTKITQLEALEHYFQNETIALDEGLKKYQEAQKLAKEIEKYLETAENTIEEIVLFESE